MNTEIHIYSDYGNTPITKRGGAYCDLLLHITIQCGNPEEARQRTIELIRDTQHARHGHFTMPEWRNRITRSGFITFTSFI